MNDTVTPVVEQGQDGQKVLEWERNALTLFDLQLDPGSTEQTRVTLLGGSDDPNSLNIKTLALLVARHELAVKQEQARFKGIDRIEDVLALGEKDRVRKLNEVDQTLKDVAQRRSELWSAIRAVRPPDENDKEGQETLRKAVRYATDIDQHLPDAFIGTSGDSLRQRMATLIEAQTLSEQDKKDRIGVIKQGFRDGEQDITQKVGEAYRQVIEPGTMKPMERAKFYFDKIYVAQNQTTVPTGQEGDRTGLSGMEATDIIIDQCQQILDLGGKYKDVQDLLKKTGIPEDWWPDKLVGAMQAWRKTEAALQRVRLADQYEKENKDKNATKVPITIDDVKNVIETYAGTYPELANNVLSLIETNKDLVEKLKGGLEKLGDTVTLTSGITSFVKLMSETDDGVEKTKSGERQETIDKGIESASAFGDVFNGIMETIKSSGALTEATKSFFENQLLPGLSLAKTGIDIIQTGKALVKNYSSKQDSTALKTTAKGEQGRGGREDGGTFANAMGNEQSAMNKQLAKGGVDMFTHILAGSGELAGTFGGAHGKIAQVALKITATGISLGSKAVFTGIDWAEAKRAKEMLEEARKGNPIAKVEIFKNSNTYAKMYLVQLVRDHDPLAEQFIIAKGISEENLTKGVSEKLLMQALLSASGQQDDAPGEEDETGVNIARHLKTEEYDPKWAFAGTVVLARKSYDAVKDAAVEKGLANIATGTGGKLEQAEPLLEAADISIRKIGSTKLSPANKSGTDHRDALQGAIAALGAVDGAILASSPMTARLDKDGKKDRNGKPRTHAGMSAYLANLLEMSRGKQAWYDKNLRESGVKDVAWTPPNPGAPLDGGVWKANWDDAVLRACLPKDDNGVNAGLASLAQKWLAFEDARKKTDGKATRVAALAVTEAFTALSDGLESCRTAAGAVPAMQEYLMRILLAAGAQSRAAQDAINPTAWKPSKAIKPPIDAAQWTEQFNDAIAQGFIGKGEKSDPVADALRALTGAQDLWAKAKDQKSKFAAEDAHAVAIATLDKALAPFRSMIAPLAEAVDKVLETARRRQEDYDKARADVSFKPVSGLDKAAWNQTFKNAVDAGAVPGGRIAEQASGQLAETIGAASDSIAALAKMLQINPRPFDKLRAEAAIAKKAIEAAIRAVDQMKSVPGFDNKIMADHLERGLRVRLEGMANADVLTNALAGKLSTGYAAPTDFTPTKTGLAGAIAAAVKNGVITAPKRDVPSFVALLLGDRDRLDKAKTNASMPQTTRDEYRAAALDTVGRLSFQLNKLESDSENPSWKGYITKAKTWVEEQRVEIRKRGDLEPKITAPNQRPPQGN